MRLKLHLKGNRLSSIQHQPPKVRPTKMERMRRCHLMRITTMPKALYGAIPLTQWENVPVQKRKQVHGGKRI